MKKNIPIAKIQKPDECLLSQLLEGEKDDAKAWDGEALLEYIKREASKNINLYRSFNRE